MNDSIETSESMARTWTPPRSEGTASAMRMLPVDEQLLHRCAVHQRFLLSDGRPALALVGGGHERPFADEEREAIGARLVATWNACQGISTETLQLVPRFTEAGVKAVQAVEAQRDTLLAALRGLYANMVAQDLGVEGDRPTEDEYRQCMYAAAAAIAKAET